MKTTLCKKQPKVTMIMVMSLDGITCRPMDYNVQEWTSKEDKQHFRSILNHFDAFISGRTSFKPHLTEVSSRPFYVLTRDRSLLDTTPSKQVTYVSPHTPWDLISKIKDDGHSNIALLGGATTNTHFLEAGLVDELIITVEPAFFGAGLHLSRISPLNLDLTLLEIKQLNKKGTLLLTYKINNHDNVANKDSSSLSMVKPKELKNINLEEITKINQEWWDERAHNHYTSQFYDVPEFIKGKNRVFDFEIKEIGDIKNKDLLHLQCHIGLETLSWARLGANVTGLDFSSESIKKAQQLAQQCGLKAEFVVSNVFDAPEELNGKKFDIVYVNFGSLHWMHNINDWAKIVSSLLKKGGILYMHEIHPLSVALSDEMPLFERDYFYSGAHLWYEPGSYADGCNDTKHNTISVWERPLGEIINAIAEAGLKIDLFTEKQGHVEQQYPYLVQAENGFWYPPKGIPSVPASFTLKASKI